MNVTDRLTRARASRNVWAGLLVLFVLLLVVSIGAERRAIHDEERRAQERAVHATETTLFRNLDAQLVSAPILREDFDTLLVPVQAEIMTDEDVARVRLFDESGSLLFSTDELDPTTATVDLGPAFASALAGEATSMLAPAGSVPADGLAGSNEDLYQSFVPLRVPGVTEIVGVAEIDARHALLVAAARSPWRAFEVVLGFGVLVLAGLTVLSSRSFDHTIDLGAVVRPPRSEPGGDDAAQLRQELAEARSQLRQAEEAFRFREAQRIKSGEPALRAEVGELREALAAAEASADRASAEAAGAKAAESNRLEELEDQLLEEQLRRANLERAAQDAAMAAEIAERERSKELEEARAELDGARAQLEAVLFEARAAAGEAERARQALAEERAKQVPADVPSEPEEEPAAPARAAPPKPRTPKRTAKPAGTKTRRSRSTAARRAEVDAPPEPPNVEVTESEGAPDDPAA